MSDKFIRIFRTFCDVAEKVLAIATAATVVIAFIGLIPDFGHFWHDPGNMVVFEEVLGRILEIVVGTEFIRMLLHPSMHNVTEVLIFLVARHMIVAKTTPADDLISIISIAILFGLNYLLERGEGKKSFFNFLKRKMHEENEDGSGK